MQKKICFLLALICLGISALTLEEYPEYELQTPEVIFQELEYANTKNHPQIQKLVFITPWNNDGKKLTVKYANKIKYVSPCWYQMIEKNGKITFENDQLVDHEYLKQIKSSNSEIKIIPRVYLNNFEVFRLIGTSQTNFLSAISLIVEMVQKHGFDGIVWDSPYDLFNKDQKTAPLNNLIFEFVNQIKHFLISTEQKDLILFFNMANPSKRKLDNNLYKNLNVDGILLQNYDSPFDFIQIIKNSVEWIQQVKPKAKQVIMMLPFFSYKNGQGMSTLDAKKQLQRDGINLSGFERGMCKFLSQKKYKYLVPCYKYFEQAYKILKQSGYYAGYWQGGNGLQSYYMFM